MSPTVGDTYVRPHMEPHALCVRLRELRRAAGMSLHDVEEIHGISAVALASYERGDRCPSIWKIDEILHLYGYRLGAARLADDARQSGGPVVRTTAELARDLRDIAAQVEAAEAVRQDTYANA